MPLQIGFVFAPPVRYIMCKLMLTDFVLLLYGKHSCLPLQVTCLEISVVLNM